MFYVDAWLTCRGGSVSIIRGIAMFDHALVSLYNVSATASSCQRGTLIMDSVMNIFALKQKMVEIWKRQLDAYASPSGF